MSKRLENEQLASSMVTIDVLLKIIKVFRTVADNLIKLGSTESSHSVVVPRKHCGCSQALVNYSNLTKVLAFN